MTIKNRLFAILAIVATGLAAISIALFASLGSIREVDSLNASSLSLRLELYHFRNVTDELLTAASFSGELKDWKAEAATMDREIKDFYTSKRIEGNLTDEEGRKALKALQNLWAIVSPQVATLQAKADLLEEKLPSGSMLVALKGGVVEAALLMNDMDRLRLMMDQYLEAAFAKIGTIADSRSTAVAALVGLISIVISLASIVVSILVIARFIATFARSMSLFSSSIRNWKAGDLSVGCATGGHDELADLGTDLDQTIEAFSGLIGEVKSIASNADELRSEIAAASEESSAAMRQIGTNIGSIAENVDSMVGGLTRSAGAAADIDSSVGSLGESLSRQAESIERAGRSTAAIDQSISAVLGIAAREERSASELALRMGEEASRFAETARLIEENAQDVSMIVDIIAIIDAIAEQTNILSMNAAIEAAHAGDAGRGFAVVAEEIRKLAESTNENASMIQSTIDSLAKRIEVISREGKSSNASLASLESSSREASSAMAEISRLVGALAADSSTVASEMGALADSARQIRSRTGEIETGAKSAATALSGVESYGLEIRNGMSEMNKGARETSEAMERVRDLSKKNSETVGELSSRVAAYKTRADSLAERIEPSALIAESEYSPGSHYDIRSDIGE
jgi:methyl-accepting chemotaxis protein